MGIDIVRAKSSQTYAYTIWKNYQEDPKASGVTAAEIKEIENAWGQKVVARWQEIYENDENEYDFPDDDFKSSYESGKENIKEQSGASGKADKLSAGDVAGTCLIAHDAAVTATLVSTSLVCSEGTFLAVKGVTKEVALKNALVAALIVFALASFYFATSQIFKNAHYNRKQADDLKEIKDNILPDAQGELSGVQYGLDETVGELEELSEDAEDVNDESNEEIKDKKAEFDVYMRSYEYLYNKLQKGEQLTPDEMQFMQDLGKILTELGITIEDLTKVTEEDVQAIFEDMEGYEDLFAEYSDKMAEILGKTDFVAQFDEATVENAQKAKTIAQVGAWAGGVIGIANGIVIAKAAAAISGFFTMGMGIAAMAIATVSTALAGFGAKAFGDAAKEQKDYKDIAKEAVAVRQETQAMNDDTQDIFDDSNDIYGDYKDLVGELELEVPTDEEMAVPEANGTTTTTTASAPTGGTNGGQTGGVNNNPGNNTGAGQTGNVNGNNGNPFAQPSGGNTTSTGGTQNNGGIKDNNSSDNFARTTDILGNNLEPAEIKYNDGNRVILAPQYINAICTVTNWQDQNSGPKFNKSFIPQIIAKLAGLDDKLIENVMNGGKVDSQYANDVLKTLTGEKTGSGKTDNSDEVTKKLKQIISYYEPIITQASANGWCRG